LREQPIHPQVVICADSQDQRRFVQAIEIARLRLVFLGVDIGWHDADDANLVAADYLGKTFEIVRRGDNADPLVREDRFADRQAQHAAEHEKSSAEAQP